MQGDSTSSGSTVFGARILRYALHLFLLLVCAAVYLYVSEPAVRGINTVNARHATSAVVISPDLSVMLPRGGVLYRLGGIEQAGGMAMPQQSASDIEYQNIRRAIEIELSATVVQGEGGGSDDGPFWDMLWSDYHGAFGQNITTLNGTGATTIAIPWRYQSQAQPLFLVLYNCGENVTVRYVEDDVQMSKQHVVQIDSDEVFSYPRRELNFRSRLGNSSGLVTLCTQLTPERLHYLEYIAQTWRGPISAVIYVGFRFERGQDMQRITKFWDNGREEVRSHVDLHLVYDDKKPWFASGSDVDNNLGQNPYPINLLRQISVDAARTEWVYLTEADMIPMPGAHDAISDSWEEMMKVVSDDVGRGTAFVVPLYAASQSADGNTVRQFPSSKAVLLDMGRKKQDFVSQGNILKRTVNLPADTALNRVRPKKSIAMDYKEWEALADGDATTFLPFHESGSKGIICKPPDGYGPQEPYFIVKKDVMPPYNVLFAGMYWDKVTQVNDMCNCGFTFYIHPNIFSLIFQAPKTAIYTWAMMFGKFNWRQEFVFALVPVFFQEVWRAKLSSLRQGGGESHVNGNNNEGNNNGKDDHEAMTTTTVLPRLPPCAAMAQRDEESFPYPAWIPAFANASKASKPKAYRIVG